MAAVILQMIPYFQTNFSENSFFSANIYETYIVSKEYCKARHDGNMYFLPKCRYHIILIGDNKESVQKLDAFCFNNQHVHCLYELFKYLFIGKIVLKSGQLFDKRQRAFHSNPQNKRVDRMPSIAKKRLLKKKEQRAIV